MAYLPKQIVEKNIRTRVRKDRHGNDHTDYEAYLGVDPFSRKPIRMTRTEKADLLADIKEFYQRHQAGGDAAVRLTAMQALDAKNAFDALAAAKLKMSLFDAVSAYIGGGFAQAAQAGSSKKVGEAFEEYFDTKRTASDADRRRTQYSTGRWVKACADRMLASLTAKEILDYLEKNFGSLAPKTYNSHLLYIKTFLNWCCKDEQGYLAKNPIRSTKFKAEPWEEPEYMPVESVEKLFRLLESRKGDRPELLAYAIVNFFCGCRAIEIIRMATDPDAAKIDIGGETVRIAKAKGYQQGKRPRAFHIHPTALAWMKSFDFMSALGKVTDGLSGTQAKIYALARENGIAVCHNAGRHSFITYHVAAYGDPAKTTAMVGTSEKMRADNYCGLARKEQGEAYFAILPTVSDETTAP